MRERDSEFPKPVSDPEAEGLPGTADDDSTAGDDVLTGREADGPDPAQLPADRPLAVDRFGTTAEEQLDGESLDYKITREQPERAIDDPLAGPVDPGIAAEADSDEAAAEAQLDADVMDDGPTSDPRSPVSIYDHGQLGDAPGGGPVGRLVEPDQGARYDDETDSIAYDAGAAGGGASAEELAVNETDPPPSSSAL
ncbi:DUF5709 domain-containing protein [Plantactinospora sonchi]|uniref:DUF5709 domain-containing protein n=1 Tax=Plantactinospora sonchi TaxID=1544735 RepID=A0ABU7RKW0_9ACTN